MVKQTITNEKDFSFLPIVGHQPADEKEEKFLREVCEFEFFNLENTGLNIRFPYGNTNIFKKFIFFHGGKYRIPRHVAHHLENCTTPLYSWKPDGSGNMISTKTGTQPRFQMRQLYGR